MMWVLAVLRSMRHWRYAKLPRLNSFFSAPGRGPWRLRKLLLRLSPTPHRANMRPCSQVVPSPRWNTACSICRTCLKPLLMLFWSHTSPWYRSWWSFTWGQPLMCLPCLPAHWSHSHWMWWPLTARSCYSGQCLLNTSLGCDHGGASSAWLGGQWPATGGSVMGATGCHAATGAAWLAG